MNTRCPECGKTEMSTKKDGSNHEEGCQIGCEEQFHAEHERPEFPSVGPCPDVVGWEPKISGPK